MRRHERAGVVEPVVKAGVHSVSDGTLRWSQLSCGDAFWETSDIKAAKATPVVSFDAKNFVLQVTPPSVCNLWHLVKSIADHLSEVALNSFSCTRFVEVKFAKDLGALNSGLCAVDVALFRLYRV